MGTNQSVKDTRVRGLEPLRTCQDQALAVSLVRDAGELLVQLQMHATESHLSAQQLKSKGGAISQRFLDAALQRERPLDTVLSEEAADNPARILSERVWIIHPLDGKRGFSEGRPDWAVDVALCERGELVAGAVSLPGIGCMIGDDALIPWHSTRRSGRLRIAVSRSRPPEFAGRVAEVLGAELVPMGSAGYKTWAVSIGEVDAYIHAGGQYEWDLAGPVFAARRAGLHASRLDGSPLAYNQVTPFLPDLLLCKQEISWLMTRAIAGVLGVD